MIAPSFWVIEKYVSGRLNYWSAHARGRGSEDDWSFAIEWATKFYNQESAEQILCSDFCCNQGRVAEHSMVAP